MLNIFKKDNKSFARKLSEQKDELKALKSRKRYAYFGMAMTGILCPLLLTAFGPIFAITATTIGIATSTLAAATYDTLITHYNRRHGLKVGRLSNFIANQFDKSSFAREIFACKDEADELNRQLRGYFLTLAERHEKTLEAKVKAEATDDKEKIKTAKQVAENDISVYQKTLKILSPASNLVKAGTFALVIATIGRRYTLASVEKTPNPTTPQPYLPTQSPTTLFFLRVSAFASIAVVTALQAKIALAKAEASQQKHIPNFIRTLHDYSGLIPGLNSVGNFFIRRELKKVDREIDVSIDFISDINNLNILPRLKHLSKLSHYEPKKLLKSMFDSVASSTSNDNYKNVGECSIGKNPDCAP